MPYGSMASSPSASTFRPTPPADPPRAGRGDARLDEVGWLAVDRLHGSRCRPRVGNHASVAECFKLERSELFAAHEARAAILGARAPTSPPVRHWLRVPPGALPLPRRFVESPPHFRAVLTNCAGTRARFRTAREAQGGEPPAAPHAVSPFGSSATTGAAGQPHALFSRGELMSIPAPWLVAQRPPSIQRT
jgi:hypothetical protein